MNKGIRSQKEVAKMLGITRSTVESTERSALRKLARHPVMQELAAELWPDFIPPRPRLEPNGN